MTKKTEIYLRLKAFKSKYPLTISWRLAKHANIMAKHLTEGETIKYAFAAQKNDHWYDIITTYALVLTNKRILIGTKRVIFGYFFISITPDMFNDITIRTGAVWGKVYIDTIKEYVTLSNIQKEALPEIQKHISGYMLEEKKKYIGRDRNKDNEKDKENEL